MKNLKIRHKLSVGFLTVCLFAIMVGLVGLLGMGSINSADETLYNHHLLSTEAIGEIRENLQAQRVILRNYVIFSGNMEKIQDTTKTLKELENSMVGLFAEYENTILDKSQESSYYEAKRQYLNDFATIKENARIAGGNSFEASMERLTDPFVATTTNAILSGFTTAMDSNKQLAGEAVSKNTALYRNMVVLTITIIIVAIIFSIVLAFYLSGIIGDPMVRMSKALAQFGTTGDLEMEAESAKFAVLDAQRIDEIGVCTKSALDLVNNLLETQQTLGRMADGDLTMNIKVLSDRDGIGQSMEKVRDSLSNMFGEINNATIQVATASKQVSNGSQTLAQGSSEQASAVEQLSSTISEIAKKTRDNAEISKQAALLADTIKQNAENGSHKMDVLINAVKEIQEASKNIDKVIKVIDDIAFQTNILALNAAVEAARAGQNGKGFAVVADEVRNLAAKSAEAAKDTESLISNSIEKTELGARIAGQTAESLSEIVTGINESSRIIGNIASSSAEQRAAVEQINIGIEQVASVVQHNSATAQESASVSEEMSEQARSLEKLVSRFKIKNTDTSFANADKKKVIQQSVFTGKY